MKGHFLTDFPKDTIGPIRASLTKLEIGRVRELGQIVAAEVAWVAKCVRPGWSEHEIAARLIGRIRGEGILPAVLLVAADRRLDRYRHPIPTTNRLRRKLMIACCPRKWGLTVAMTRIVHFGKLPKELVRRHDAVCRMMIEPVVNEIDSDKSSAASNKEVSHSSSPPGRDAGSLASALVSSRVVLEYAKCRVR